MKKSILLFDVDGTICEAGKQITYDMANMLLKYELNSLYEIGIVGGGKFDKIIYQLNKLLNPEHIFSECGSVYHKLINGEYIELYRHNIRKELEYPLINKLVKSSLRYLSNVDYLVSGHLIDLRDGLIYISLVGMTATEEERQEFIKINNEKNYRKELIDILKTESSLLGLDGYLDIVYGGSVGIAIYPKKWDKIQVLDIINSKEYNKIYYFGDRYESDGNDYNIISDKRVIGIRINSINDTINKLMNIDI